MHLPRERSVGASGQCGFVPLPTSREVLEINPLARHVGSSIRPKGLCLHHDSHDLVAIAIGQVNLRMARQACDSCRDPGIETT